MIQYEPAQGSSMGGTLWGSGNSHVVIDSVFMPVPAPETTYHHDSAQITNRPPPMIQRSRRNNASVALVKEVGAPGPSRSRSPIEPVQGR